MNKTKIIIGVLVVLGISMIGNTLNVRAERSWDIVLISAFNSMADLDEYRIHPEHLKALEFIAPRREIVSAVDFEY